MGGKGNGGGEGNHKAEEGTKYYYSGGSGGEPKRVGLLQVEIATKSKIPRHHHLNMGKFALVDRSGLKSK